MPKQLAFIFATVLGAIPLAADAQDGFVECSGDGISVWAETPELQSLLCGLADEAVSSITSCQLPQIHPVRIEVVGEIVHPFATCLAAFDCDHDRIRIVVRDDYTELVEPDDPYADFPPDVLLRTLLFHEITHALIEQNSLGREVPPVDHEYISASIELAHMEPSWRQTILDYANLDVPAEGRINIWTYRMDPRRFAANAWLHFQLPQNGCDLVGQILARETTFDSQGD